MKQFKIANCLIRCLGNIKHFHREGQGHLNFINEKGNSILKKKDGRPVYYGKKGASAWAKNVEPEYYWEKSISAGMDYVGLPFSGE